MKKKLKRKRSLYDKFSYSNRNTNIFLVCTFLILLFCLTIGYSILSNVLSIKGDIVVRPTKDIRITNITGPVLSNGAYENTNFRFSHNLLQVNGVLPNNNSSLTYTITIKNNGTSDMNLTDIINTCNNSNIYYELNGINLGDTIEAGKSVTFTLTLKTRSGSNTTFNSQLQFVFEKSYMDITAPEITFNPEPSNACHSSSYKVNIKATDDIEVTSFLWCQITGNNSSCDPNTVGNKDGTEVTINTDNNYHVICVKASDSSKYGPNVSLKCSNENNNYYKLDTIAPSVTFNTSGGEYNNSVDVNFSLSDSGCGNSSMAYQYCTTTSSSCTPNITGSGTSKTISLTDLGSYKICVKTTDNVGNGSEIICSDTYTIKIPPEITFSTNSSTLGNTYYSNLVRNANITSSVGLSSVKYCITTSSSCTPSTSYSVTSGSTSVTVPVTFGSNSSAQKLCVSATDTSGTTTTQCDSSTYKVDTTAPTGDASVSLGQRVIELWADLVDEESGILKYEYFYGTDSANTVMCSAGTSSPCSKTFPYGIYKFKVIAHNNAGLNTTKYASYSYCSDGGNVSLVNGTCPYTGCATFTDQTCIKSGERITITVKARIDESIRNCQFRKLSDDTIVNISKTESCKYINGWQGMDSTATQECDYTFTMPSYDLYLTCESYWKN